MVATSANLGRVRGETFFSGGGNFADIICPEVPYTSLADRQNQLKERFGTTPKSAPALPQKRPRSVKELEGRNPQEKPYVPKSP